MLLGQGVDAIRYIQYFSPGCLLITDALCSVQFAVPASVSDEDLKKVSAFRSRERIPVS